MENELSAFDTAAPQKSRFAQAQEQGKQMKENFERNCNKADAIIGNTYAYEKNLAKETGVPFVEPVIQLSDEQIVRLEQDSEFKPANPSKFPSHRPVITPEFQERMNKTFEQNKQNDKFDNTKKFEDPSGVSSGIEFQDKITTKITAKGEIQAEVRIGGILTTNNDIDNLIGKHKHAWEKLKIEFPNLVKPKENKK